MSIYWYVESNEGEMKATIMSILMLPLTTPLDFHTL